MSRIFGPHSSDGIPIEPGTKVSVRVVHEGGSPRTLDRLRFGIALLESDGQAGVFPGGGGGSGPVWQPGEGEFFTAGNGESVHEVTKWDADGTKIWATNIDDLGQGLSARPNRLALDLDGNVFALSRRRLVKLDPDGVVLWDDRSHDLAGAQDPTQLAVDADGAVYVAAFVPELRKFGSDGTPVWTNTDSSSNVSGVCVYPGRGLWFADQAGRLRRADLDGNVAWSSNLGGGLAQVSVDPDENAYVCTSGVKKVDPDGVEQWHTDSGSTCRYIAMASGVDEVFTNLGNRLRVYALSDGTGANWGPSAISLTAVAVDPDESAYETANRSGAQGIYRYDADKNETLYKNEGVPLDIIAAPGRREQFY